ncbi:unnamed protein product [Rotaria sp. Silwood1]|nr:unnamed protein product [Rotaria sp. Silwood1]CAF4789287.1 unnamed protein product [Rotaria sp. Silwood1]
MYIRKDSSWKLGSSFENLLAEGINYRYSKDYPSLKTDNKHIEPYDEYFKLNKVDVIFPVMHGAFGEDGSIQGLLNFSQIPFVGSGILGSSVCMDKDVTKRLLLQADIPVAKYLSFTSNNQKYIDFQKIKTSLGLPFFVKPANSGSSVGISKVVRKEQFNKAINVAFKFDRKILIEECITGRELECSVIGNDNCMVSEVGEVTPNDEFYSYEAKYYDESGAVVSIPANIPEKFKNQIQNLSKKAYLVLGCEGMARIDFFLSDKNKILVNEINTIPGFTENSMFAKLWEVSGISKMQLVDRLVQLAIDRHKANTQIKNNSLLPSKILGKLKRKLNQ